MTWVIGICGIGHAVVIGDVRVSIMQPGSSTITPVRECAIRKVGLASDGVLVGFAGTIPRAFTYLSDFGRFLAADVPDRELREQVADWLGAREANPLDFAPETPTKLIALQVSPTRDFGPPEIRTGMGLTSGVVIDLPWEESVDFGVEEFGVGESKSIGSGAGVPSYAAVLQAATTLESLVGVSNFGRGIPDGSSMSGMVIAHALWDAFKKELEPTVSRDIIFGVLDRAGSAFYDTFGPNPPFVVAKDPRELNSCLKSRHGVGAEAALS
jgi:hypothetical protein